jgi:hypothetical protein
VAAEAAHLQFVEQLVPTTFPDQDAAQLLAAAATTGHGSGHLCATHAKSTSSERLIRRCSFFVSGVAATKGDFLVGEGDQSEIGDAHRPSPPQGESVRNALASRQDSYSEESFLCILLCEFPSLVPGHLGIAGLATRVQSQIHSVNGDRNDNTRQHESQESHQNGSNFRGVFGRPEIAVTDCGCRDK